MPEEGEKTNKELQAILTNLNRELDVYMAVKTKLDTIQDKHVSDKIESEQEKGETEHLQKSKTNFLTKLFSYGSLLVIVALAFFCIGYCFALLPIMSFINWPAFAVLSITLFALSILVYVLCKSVTKLLAKKTKVSKGAELAQLQARLQLYIAVFVALIGGVVALWIFAYGAGRADQAWITILLTLTCIAGATGCIVLYVVDIKKFGKLL